MPVPTRRPPARPPQRLRGSRGRSQTGEDASRERDVPVFRCATRVGAPKWKRRSGSIFSLGGGGLAVSGGAAIVEGLHPEPRGQRLGGPVPPAQPFRGRLSDPRVEEDPGSFQRSATNSSCRRGCRTPSPAVDIPRTISVLVRPGGPLSKTLDASFEG